MKYFIIFIIALVIGFNYANKVGHRLANQIALQATQEASKAIEETMERVSTDMIQEASKSLDSTVENTVASLSDTGKVVVSQ